MNDCAKEFEKAYNNKMLEDQFSDRTRAVRRNLLFLVTMALSLSYPDIEFGKFLWLDLTEQPSIEVARGLITSVMTLELIVFISYGITDFLNWNSLKYKVVYDSYKNHTEQLFAHSKLASNHLNDISNTEINLSQDELQKQKKIAKDFKVSIYKILEQDTKVRKILGKKLTMFNGVLWLRIFLIDWLIPLSGASIVLILNYGYMINSVVKFSTLFTGSLAAIFQG